jgi:putative DNA primase/helicase
MRPMLATEWTDGTAGEWATTVVMPQNPDEETLQRLAALSVLEYERVRDSEAKKLKCRTAILDKLVDGKRQNNGDALQGRGVNLPDVELWPEPVNGAEVLAQTADTFRQYIALTDGAADVLALWCAHTHGFNAFICSPRLNISSPEKCCGKTTLRDVVAEFVPRSVLTENLSVAVLFRLVEAHTPTILADEYDSWINDKEELRGLLNAGHRRGASVLRCEGDGNEVRAFAAYAPAVLCGIGALPGTLQDRSIIVKLERAKPTELHTRFDPRHTEREQELCRKLARWVADNVAQLEAADPFLPDGVFNRLADNWRPLFAIAEIAGSDWPQRCATAFAKLTSRDDAEAQGIGAVLLTDIRQVLAENGVERIFSRVLVGSLSEMKERPWPEAQRGKPITERWVARQLARFGIHSKTLRIGEDRAKGYETADFTETFERYIPNQEQNDP